MSDPPQPPKRPLAPPPQKNLDRALELGFQALAAQSDEQMIWLGAEPVDRVWRLRVLDDLLLVDPPACRVSTAGGREVRPHWGILALHYLAIASRPETRPPEITFADLPTARFYAGVYQGRVIARLCATVGRDGQKLRAAAVALGAAATEGGDAAFDFRPFPRLAIRVIWHAPDDEFPPTASLLLPANIEQYFCSEDIVVLSESLVSRLAGRPF